MNDNVRQLCNVMSLRKPQEESLNILASIIREIFDDTLTPTLSTGEGKLIIDKINALDILNKKEIFDFERNFPSLCFSIATGVGKTRLMGAFIAYLHIEFNIKNFFVVAPNLTIYNKLITDFTPNTPKYVFKGIQEFATNSPYVFTGDDYHGLDFTRNFFEDQIKISIFNISKINRDKDSKGTPRFRRLSEQAGTSYFDYLKSLPDLVLLMDEAHRYRATAGMNVINELNPILGLEVTATAKTIGSSSKPFKNIIYHYSLAHAIQDKFVKKPTVSGRSDFDKDRYNETQLEDLKLNDGFSEHEDVKVELEVYANTSRKHLVKPFLLIIAKDIAHAEALKNKINSDSYKEGKYKGKVIVVHSEQVGTEKDDNVSKLLEVEKTDNPIEVVIHVNMLAEGWDVNNLYTIVPLKPARTDILVEQSIGRGLRLPYGTQTGIDAIDRLTIIAHDKFKEIIDIAQAEGFAFQKRELDKEEDAGKLYTVYVPSVMESVIKEAEVNENTESISESKGEELIFKDQTQKELAKAYVDSLQEQCKAVKTIDEIKNEHTQERMINKIVQKEKDAGNLFASTGELKENLIKIAPKITEHFYKNLIRIPKVRFYEKQDSCGLQYNKFFLNLEPFSNLSAVTQNIIKQEIIKGKKEIIKEAVFVDWEGPTEKPIIKKLYENTAIPGNILETLMYFAKQVTDHIKSYTQNELEVRKIVWDSDAYIADEIVSQMILNVINKEVETIIEVLGDTVLCTSAVLKGNKDYKERDYRITPKRDSETSKYILTGFSKCINIKVKFDSDTERKMAKVLEEEPDVLKWQKPTLEQAREIFSLEYQKSDGSYHDYCPDFIVETISGKYLVETKRRDQIVHPDVRAKKDVAVKWCVEASKYENSINGKEWSYLLIPDDVFDKLPSWQGLVADTWSRKK